MKAPLNGKAGRSVIELPASTSDLDDIVRECQRQTTELREIFAALDPAESARRPGPKKWSRAGHLAHLVLVNHAYVPALEATVDSARAAGGPKGDGPFRHPRISSWFVAAQAPPPRWRVRTFRSMVPDPEVDVDDVMDAFTGLQRRLVDTIEASRGLDLGRVRFRSPLLALLRLSLGAGYGVVVEHNRRHIWLIKEVNRALRPG